MAKQLINLGTLPNDGTGDNLRAGGEKHNDNINEIYTAIGDGSTISGAFKIQDDTSTEISIQADGSVLKISGGTGINATVTGGNDLQIEVDGTVLSAAQVSTLTNKTINLTDNTITGTLAEFNTAVSDATLVSLTGSEALTNKTIDASSNTLSNIANSSLTNSSITISDDSSTTDTIALGQSFAILGGSGVDTSISSGQLSISISGITNANLSGSAAISNANLENSTITLGDDVINLGDTQTTITNLSLDGSTGTIDLTSTGNIIRQNFANFGSLPSATTYNGAFATEDTTFRAFFAQASSWIEIISENSSIGKLSNVDITTSPPTNGQTLIFNSTSGIFEPGAAGGYSAGTDLDLEAANLQDAGYISHRSADSTVTKTLTVTVAVKTDEHYEFGSGSLNGYVIDGDQSPHLTLSKGVYEFDQSDASNSTHPLKFYLDRDKNIEMSTGVVVSGTPGTDGKTTITITDATPTPLYYQCTAHSYMGHSLDIVGGKESNLNISTTTLTGDLAGPNSGKSFTILANRTVENILVFVNGLCLVPTTDYTVSGTNLTFDTAPATGAEIMVRYLG